MSYLLYLLLALLASPSHHLSDREENPSEEKHPEQMHPESEKGDKIMADKNIIDGQELESVSGGQGGAGYNLIVGDCNGNYLALRPQPVWDQYHELARLYPGYQVMTYGQTTRGTGLQGVPCTYTYVYWNGMWGWANSAFLR